MTDKLKDIESLGNREATERAAYAITVLEGLAAGTLVDQENAVNLLNEMKDASTLAGLEVPAEVQTALTSALDESISSL